MKKQILFIASFMLAINIGCTSCKHNAVDFSADEAIAYCAGQATKTLAALPSLDKIPNSIDADSTEWNYTNVGSWTCSFWPGILWYLYEDTQDEKWREVAEQVTNRIAPLGYRRVRSHDSGFIMMCSVGNGYRLTRNEAYKEAMLHAADSLTALFNPVVGTFLSWPNMVKRENWPHNTIIDNMMNLELLFWAARNGGSKKLYDIACKHAKTTMKYHFREDYSCYHVAVYDTIDGHFIKGVTHQGARDDSMWARGQAWAVYGYTMVYRETRDIRFLEQAQKVADVYLSRLPEDMVPYWDFDAPELSERLLKDASAAAITASALLELSTLMEDTERAEYYYTAAVGMLKSLSSADYQARDKNSAFLLHCVGHMHRGWELDASISYADYYYLEALMRLKHLQAKRLKS